MSHSFEKPGAAELIKRPEPEYWFRDKNALCSYLIDTVYEYPKTTFDYVYYVKKDPIVKDLSVKLAR